MSAVGFTGTSKGCTEAQLETLASVVATEAAAGATGVSHGDCVGADAQFDLIAADAGLFVTAHPGHDKTGESPHRAWCAADAVHTPAPYLQRNKVIVDSTDSMIACPSGFTERQRGSGTWHAVRYARAQRKRLTIVWPDGTLTRENGDMA